MSDVIVTIDQKIVYDVKDKVYTRDIFNSRMIKKQKINRKNKMIEFALVGCGRAAKRHSELLGLSQIENASSCSM